MVLYINNLTNTAHYASSFIEYLLCLSVRAAYVHATSPKYPVAEEGATDVLTARQNSPTHQIFVSNHRREDLVLSASAQTTSESTRLIRHFPLFTTDIGL